MKNLIATTLICSLFFGLTAQNENELFGIVRKNYYSYQTDPIDTNFTYEVFDSATVRLGKLNTLSGYVENISQTASSYAVNLTGAALNPYTNSYLFFGGNQFITLDLNTGQISSQVNLSNPNGESYFDNFRFNHSDSTIYGLARRNNYDSLGGFIGAEMFLSRLNAATGEIQQISPNSIGNGFAYAGSAIDPYQMVYYYSIGDAIVGLDMYNGEIYNSFPIPLSDGIMFDNFTYSCADSALYGLIRHNYFSTITDSLDPLFGTQNLDSTSIKLGKINTTLGIIETISPSNLPATSYSVNASAAIDPETMTYYFSSGNNILGVSMLTGLITHNNQLSFQEGDYFDLMRNIGNCISATKARLNSSTSGIQNLASNDGLSICPNPAKNEIQISFENTHSNTLIQVVNQTGQLVLETELDLATTNKLNISSLTSGIYFISIKNQSLKPQKIIVLAD